jgi:hypothetical protein
MLRGKSLYSEEKSERSATSKRSDVVAVSAVVFVYQGQEPGMEAKLNPPDAWSKVAATSVPKA